MGAKTHMGYNQEAYDAECAALARLLETLARSLAHLKREISEWSPALSKESGHSKEVQNTRQAGPEQSGRWRFEETGRFCG